MRIAVGIIELVFLLVWSLPVGYLLVLAGAAALYRRPAARPAAGANFAILVPAHDEALTLPAVLPAITALRGQPGTPAPLVVVIADNCSDATAEIARQAGVVVYERHDPTLRGKGHAMAWATARLMQDAATWDALVVFDADTIPDAAFLREAQTALDGGAEVVQGCYDVLNPHDSWRTLLLYSAFVIYNHIRPLGRARLGLSDGLRGNGMIFRRAVLEAIPWQASSLVEDIEFTTRLVLAGEAVTYAPRARIFGQAAATRQSAASQRKRWEGGRIAQARHDVPLLVRRALRKADLVALDRAVDLLIPPLALLALVLCGGGGIACGLWLLLGGALLGAVALGWGALLAGLAVFVLGGLAVAGVGARAYLALAYAPVYVFWKMGLYITLFFTRIPNQWVRTTRTVIALEETQVGLE